MASAVASHTCTVGSLFSNTTFSFHILQTSRSAGVPKVFGIGRNNPHKMYWAPAELPVHFNITQRIQINIFLHRVFQIFRAAHDIPA